MAFWLGKMTPTSSEGMRIVWLNENVGAAYAVLMLLSESTQSRMQRYRDLVLQDIPRVTSELLHWSGSLGEKRVSYNFEDIMDTG